MRLTRTGVCERTPVASMCSTASRCCRLSCASTSGKHRCTGVGWAAPPGMGLVVFLREYTNSLGLVVGLVSGFGSQWGGVGAIDPKADRPPVKQFGFHFLVWLGTKIVFMQPSLTARSQLLDRISPVSGKGRSAAARASECQLLKTCWTDWAVCCRSLNRVRTPSTI